MPVPSQVVAPGHSFWGSVPALTKSHVPLVPPVSAAEHASQVPLHARSQHTESTQLPLTQSVPSEQLPPLARSATHWFVESQ